jgi:tetratricopeptide (TPR) repeat protein
MGTVVRESRWLRNLRAQPRAAVLVFCGILAASLQAILGLLEAPPGARVGAVLLVAALAVASELDKASARRQQQYAADLQAQEAREAHETDWLRRAHGCFRIWPPPQMDGVDPIDLGVVRSQLALLHTPSGESSPPYVGRDVDDLARKRLRQRGRLLIVGAPASGVTRTAYEVSLRTGDRAATPQSGGSAPYPDARIVLVPQPPLGFKTALDDLDLPSHLDQSRSPLLWLDDLDAFAPDGLTATMLTRFVKRFPGCRVVATISTTSYRLWVAEQSDVAEWFGNPVTLMRLPSVDELRAAEATYPEVDFSEGIAAAFTSARALLVRQHAGDADCPYEPIGGDCQLAREVVSLALAWTCTGTKRPLPISRLTALVQQRWGVPDPVDPEHLARALQWTAEPTVQGAALLRQSAEERGGVVEANRELAAIYDVDGRPSEFLWFSALQDAEDAGDSESIGRIGFRAHVEGEADPAARAWTRIGAFDEPAGRWLERAAVFSRQHGGARAEKALRQLSFELCEAKYGPDDPRVALMLDELGTVLVKLGDLSEGLAVHERALRIKEREFGSEDPRIAATLNNLGCALVEQGSAARACELHERALRIEEQAFGSEDPRVAHTLNNLGYALVEVGDPTMARGLHERALCIEERAFGTEDPRVAHTLNDLGIAWRHTGDPAKARDLHERALRISERAFGASHARVATALTNLGNAVREQGHFAEARDIHERALRIETREFGSDHLRVASALNNLANTEGDLGQLKAALELYERALHIKERKFGPNSVRLVSTLRNLGDLSRELGQAEKARKMHERALHIDESAFGPNNPRLVMTLNNLGNAWASLGQSARASESYERALKILHSAFPPGHPSTNIITENLRRLDPAGIILEDGSVARRPRHAPPESATS